MPSLLSKLIVDFFTSEKSVDYIIRPPVKTLSQKVDYLFGEVESAYNRAILDKVGRDSFHSDVVEMGQQLFNYHSANTTGDFLKKSERGIYVIEMIASEFSLRDFRTIITDFENRIRYFGNEIAWVDILALSFIKSHYPELTDFFERTVDYFEEKSIMNREFPLGISRTDTRDGSREALDKFISTYIPGIDDETRAKYMRLIGLVAHFYIDKIQLKNSSNAEERSLREQSTCSYSFFKKYFLQKKELDDFESGSLRLYKQLTTDFSQISKKENIEIYNLSQFVRNRISLDTSSSFYIRLADDILDRFESGKLPFAGFDNSGNGLRVKLTYEFCYLLLWYIENADNDEKTKSKVSSMLIRFLKSPVISFTSKFIVISAFVNHEKAGRGEVDFRFERVWSEALGGESNLELVSAIKQVFNQYDKIFFIGAKKSIYDNEEHYSYILYQYWSGDKDSEEVIRIRDLAIRDLKSHPDVIDHYWSNYPSVTELERKNNFSSFTYSQTGTLNLYMPLENLITVSTGVRKLNKVTRNKLREWLKDYERIKSQEKYKYIFDLTSANDTLRGLLKRKNIL